MFQGHTLVNQCLGAQDTSRLYASADEERTPTAPWQYPLPHRSYLGQKRDAANDAPNSRPAGNMAAAAVNEADDVNFPILPTGRPATNEGDWNRYSFS